MDEWSKAVIAVAAALGGGGIVAALAKAWMGWRAEGVSHTPGEVVFKELHTQLSDLKDQLKHANQLIASMAQDAATMRTELAELRSRDGVKDVELRSLRSDVQHYRDRAEELEFELQEERAAREKVAREFDAFKSSVRSAAK